MRKAWGGRAGTAGHLPLASGAHEIAKADHGVPDTTSDVVKLSPETSAGCADDEELVRPPLAEALSGKIASRCPAR